MAQFSDATSTRVAMVGTNRSRYERLAELGSRQWLKCRNAYRLVCQSCGATLVHLPDLAGTGVADRPGDLTNTAADGQLLVAIFFWKLILIFGYISSAP